MKGGHVAIHYYEVIRNGISNQIMFFDIA
jgi:hypothetical protein